MSEKIDFSWGSSADDVLSVDGVSFNRDAELVLSSSENLSMFDRSMVVEVKNEEFRLSGVITVKQDRPALTYVPSVSWEGAQTIAAAGGRVVPVITITAMKKGTTTVVGEEVLSPTTISSGADWLSKEGDAFVVASRGTTVGVSRSGMVSYTGTLSNGDSIEGSFIITQEANEESVQSVVGGDTSYGVLQAGTITNASIAAKGGSGTATAGSGSQSWTRSEKVTTYVYTSGATTQEVDPAGSGVNTIAPSVASFVRSAESKGTTVSGVTVVGSQEVTWTGAAGDVVTGTMYVYQEANVVTDANYNPRITARGVPTVSIGSGITAGGGSATVTASVNDTQTYNALYTSGSMGTDQTRSVAGSVSLSLTGNGNSRFSLSGSTLSHSSMTTNVTTDTGTVTAANANDSTKKATASVSVENVRSVTGTTGGVYTYYDVTAGAITNQTIPASGGTKTATAGNGSQRVTRTAIVTSYSYTSGSSNSATTTAASDVTNPIAPSVASKSGTASSKGTTVSGVTTVASQAVTWTGQGSKSASGTMYVYQEANAATTITYGVPTVSVTASDVPAGGGSVTSGSVTYSQSRTQNYTSGSTSALSAVTSGGSVSWSGGASNIASLGTTERGRTAVGSALTATVTMNGKSGSGSTTVYQAANVRTQTGITISRGGSSANGWYVGSLSSVPAGRGDASDGSIFLYIEGVYNYRFTSGSTSTAAIPNTLDITSTVTGSGWVWSYAAGYGTTDKRHVEIGNRTTVIGAARSGSVKWTVGGFTSNTIEFTQVLNKVTSLKAIPNGVNTSHFEYRTQIAAGGGTVSPVVQGTSVLAFSSGNTSTQGSSGSVLGGTLSFSRSYSMPATSGWSLDTSTGALTASNNTSTSTRTSGTVTGVLNVSFINPSSVGGDTVIGTSSSTTATATQSAGYYTYSAWSVAASASPTTIGAGGGTSTITGTATRTYGWNGATSGAGTQTGTVAYSIPTTTGASLSGNKLTWAGRGTTVGSERSVVVTVTCQEDKTKTATVTVKQNANAIASYGVPTGRTLSVSDIPAAGGSVSSGTVGGTISQVRTYTSGSTDTLTNPTISSSRYSTAVSASSLGKTIKSRTSVGTLTYYYTCNGKEGSVSATVYQQANSVSAWADTGITAWGTPSVSIGSGLTAAGGSAAVSHSVSNTMGQKRTYTSGSSDTQTVSRAGTTTIKIQSNGNNRFSLSGNTLSHSNMTTNATTDTVTIRATNSGATSMVKDVSASVSNSLTWANPVITYTYSDVSAGGSTVTPSVSITQSGSYSSGSTASNTTIGSKSFSGTGVNASTGAYTGSSLGTTVKSRTKLSTGTVSVTANGKTATKSADIYQAENKVTNSNYNPRITAYGTPAISIGSGIAAAGGSATVTASVSNTQTYNAMYSSGSTGPNQTRSVAGSVSLSLVANGNSRFSLSGSTLSHSSMTTNLTTDTATVRATNAGSTSATKDASVSVANTREVTGTTGGVYTYYDVSAGAISNKTIPASGGNATATAGNGSQRVTRTAITTSYKYTSGSTSSAVTTAATDVTNAISPSVASKYGSAGSKGTTVSGVTTIASQVVTWTGQGSKSASGTMYVYQAANSLSWNAPVVTMTYGDIPAGGGSVTPTVSITQSGSYTSGSTASNSTIGSKSFSGTSVNTSTGSVSGSSLGTTVKSRTKITTATVTVTANGKSASKSVDVYQAANAATTITYGVPSVSVSASDVPASGGSVTSGSVTYSQSRTQNYTSGSTSALSAVTSGGTVTWSGGATNIASLGTTLKARTSTGKTLTASVKLNGQTGTGSVTIYQAENKITANGSWTDTFTLSRTYVGEDADYVVYSGSSTRTNTYSSGSTASETSAIKSVTSDQTWTTISGSSISFTANTSATNRSATLTATYNNNRTKTATLIQSGMSGNVYIKFHNNYTQSINWQVGCTITLDRNYTSASVYSSYYSTSYGGESMSEFCGILATSDSGQTTCSEMKLTNFVVQATNTNGSYVGRQFKVWVEVQKAHVSSGQDPQLATCGSQYSPMISNGTSNSSPVSSSDVRTSSTFYTSEAGRYIIHVLLM